MTNHHEALDSDRLLVETDWLEANLDAPTCEFSTAQYS